MVQLATNVTPSGGWKALTLCITLLAAVIAMACEARTKEAETAHIAGRLTLNHQPLSPRHSVVFMRPIAGDLAYGMTDADGRFEVNSWKNGEMPAGRYRVYICPPYEGSNDEARPLVDSLPEEPVREIRLEYPARYRDMEASGLEFKVVPGQNNFEIDLSPAADASASPITP